MNFTNDARIAWSVAIVALVIALVLGGRLGAVQRQLAEATAHQQSQQQVLGSMQPATFVRAEADRLVYRTPKQETMDGMVFIGHEEKNARYADELQVFGAVTGDDWTALGDVREGAPIRVQISGSGASATVSAVYVTP